MSRSSPICVSPGPTQPGRKRTAAFAGMLLHDDESGGQAKSKKSKKNKKSKMSRSTCPPPAVQRLALSPHWSKDAEGTHSEAIAVARSWAGCGEHESSTSSQILAYFVMPHEQLLTFSPPTSKEVRTYLPDVIFEKVGFKINHPCHSVHPAQSDSAASLLIESSFDVCKEADCKRVRELAAQHIIASMNGPLPDFFYSGSFAPLSGGTSSDRVLSTFLNHPKVLKTELKISGPGIDMHLDTLIGEGFENANIVSRALAACACNIEAARIVLST